MKASGNHIEKGLQLFLGTMMGHLAGSGMGRPLNLIHSVLREKII